jgi:hypothetical protein
MRTLLLVLLVFLTVPFAWAKNACTLLTAGDVQAVLGEPAQPAPPLMMPPYGPKVEVSMCRFKTASGKTVSLMARYGEPNDSPATLVAKLKSQKMPEVREISGVGDGAVWSGAQVFGKGNYQLQINKGKYVFLLISVNGKVSEANALDDAKALAARVLPRT